MKGSADYSNPASSTAPALKKESLWDVVKFAILAIAIIIPIRLYIAQPFIVSGSSMDPTFANGQYLIIDEASYLVRDPVRGEVVIFRYPKDPSKYFIKRIIGLPGEIIFIRPSEISITSSDETFELNEPYIKKNLSLTETVRLGAGQYFVMGDNRTVSFDSRYWGPVDRDLIKGRVLLRLLPPSKIGLLPGNYNYQSK